MLSVLLHVVLNELRKSYLFQLFEQVTVAKEDGTDLLENMQASLKAKIQEAQERLATLE